ncbi:MAG: hypothetical protein ACREHV_07660, partial [Rhizomicrobium sp.]
RPERIRVGDIILTAGSGLISASIRKLTKSDFSHAALCNQPGMLLEALDTGVQRRSTIGTYVTQREWIRVLRPKNSLTPNSRGLGIADCADSIYGRAYSVRGAVASRFPLLGATAAGGMFCSQVVAEAYRLYGMPLLPGKLPSQIYPGLLLASPELSDVTDKCIRKLGSASNADTYELVVQTANQELPSDEMRLNRRAFDAIRKELGKLPGRIYSLPDLVSWLSTEFDSDAVKQSDSKILEILEREGMSKWHDEFRMNTQVLIAIFEFAADAAEASASAPISSEIEALLSDFADTAPLRQTSLQRRRATNQEYENLATKTGLKIFERFNSIYRAQYQDAERLHKAIDRMIAALKRRPSA